MSFNASSGYFGIAKQTVKGTPVTPARFLKCLDVAPKPEDKSIDGKVEISPMWRDPTIRKPGTIRFGGAVKAYLRPDSFPALLPGAGLADTKTGDATGYIHTFSPIDTLSWLTLESSMANEVIRQWSDAVIDKISVKAAKDDIVQIGATFMAITEAKVSASSVTEETAPLLSFSQGVITFDGGTTLPFEHVEMELSNHCSNGEFGIGSRKLFDITPGRRDLSFKGNVRFPDKTLYEKAMYGAGGGTAIGTGLYLLTNTSVKFTSETMIGGGAVPYSVEFKIANMYMRPFEPPMGEDKPVWCDIVCDPVNLATNLLQIIVTNDIAVAY